MLNNVSEIKPDDWVAPSSGRAILLYGVGLAEAWPNQGFRVDLDEYDDDLGRTRGDCWRYNHTEAVLPPASGTIQYFAFSVDPGYFTQSVFVEHRIEKPYDNVAFYAAAGRVTYIGDFIYMGPNKRVVLQRDLQKGVAARKTFHTLEGDPVLAQTIPVKNRYFFVCAP